MDITELGEDNEAFALFSQHAKDIYYKEIDKNDTIRNDTEHSSTL